MAAQESGNKMSDNTILNKCYLAQATYLVKTNLRNIIILLSLCFVLFLSFQLYSFYISNKIKKNSISFFSSQNTEDINAILDTITKLSNDNNFYGILATLELIDLNFEQKNNKESISLYSELLNNDSLDSVYKSAIASRASIELIDLNFDDLSLDYLETVNEFISYINEESEY